MAIVKEAIETQINSIIDSTKALKPEEAQKKFSSDLANVIVSALKSAIVTIQAGIPVTTVGSPTTQTGATTAPGTGTLS